MPTTRERQTKSPPRLLITAGPTHEPIDRVRFIGNRSSGRLGIALAEAASGRGWHVTLALGPTHLGPTQAGPSLRVVRFQSTADLQRVLEAEFPLADVLVMAAAVADYRPRPIAGQVVGQGKLSRGAGPITLELEPTPDLLAGCGAAKREGQVVVGFALEPEERLMASARSKLERKRLDMIVANPLETMDAADIQATLIMRSGDVTEISPAISKESFAGRLLDVLDCMVANHPAFGTR